jgi:hypothetical protein
VAGTPVCAATLEHTVMIPTNPTNPANLPNLPNLPNLTNLTNLTNLLWNLINLPELYWPLCECLGSTMARGASAWR